MEIAWKATQIVTVVWFDGYSFHYEKSNGPVECF